MRSPGARAVCEIGAGGCRVRRVERSWPEVWRYSGDWSECGWCPTWHGSGTVRVLCFWRLGGVAGVWAVL